MSDPAAKPARASWKSDRGLSRAVLVAANSNGATLQQDATPPGTSSSKPQIHQANPVHQPNYSHFGASASLESSHVGATGGSTTAGDRRDSLAGWRSRKTSRKSTELQASDVPSLQSVGEAVHYIIATPSVEKSAGCNDNDTRDMSLKWQSSLLADIDDCGSEVSEVYQDPGAPLAVLETISAPTALLVKKLQGLVTAASEASGVQLRLEGPAVDLPRQSCGASSQESGLGLDRDSTSRRSTRSWGSRRLSAKPFKQAGRLASAETSLGQVAGTDESSALDRATIFDMIDAVSSTISAPDWHEDDCAIVSSPESLMSASPGPRVQQGSVPSASSKWAVTVGGPKLASLEAENARLRVEIQQERQRANEAEEALAETSEALAALQQSCVNSASRSESTAIVGQTRSVELVPPQELLSRFDTAALDSTPKEPRESEVVELRIEVENLRRKNERLENQEREVAKLHEWLQIADPDTPQALNTSFSVAEGVRTSCQSINEDSTDLGSSFGHDALQAHNEEFAWPAQCQLECTEIQSSQSDIPDAATVRHELLRVRRMSQEREKELIQRHERELADFVWTVDSLREAKLRLEETVEEESREVEMREQKLAQAVAKTEEVEARQVGASVLHDDLDSEHQIVIERKLQCLESDLDELRITLVNVESENQKLQVEQAQFEALHAQSQLIETTEAAKAVELREECELLCTEHQEGTRGTWFRLEAHELADLRGECEWLAEQNARLSKEREFDTSRAGSQQREVFELRSVVDELKSVESRCAPVEAETASLHDSLEQARRSNSLEVASIEVFTEEIAMLREEASHRGMCQSEGSLHAEISRLRPLETEVDELHRSLAESSRKFESEKAEFDAQRQTINDLRRSLSWLENEHPQVQLLKSELAELRQLMNGSHHTMGKLEVEFATECRSNRIFSEEAADLQNQLEKHRCDHCQDHEEMDRLRDTVAALRTENLHQEVELQGSLSELQILQDNLELERNSEYLQNQLISEEAVAVRETLERLTQESLCSGDQEVARWKQTVNTLKSETSCLTSLEQMTADLQVSFCNKNELLERQELELAHLRNQCAQVRDLRTQCMQFPADSAEQQSPEDVPVEHELVELHRAFAESQTQCRNIEESSEHELVELHRALAESQTQCRNIEESSEHELVELHRALAESQTQCRNIEEISEHELVELHRALAESQNQCRSIEESSASFAELVNKVTEGSSELNERMQKEVDELRHAQLVSEERHMSECEAFDRVTEECNRLRSDMIVIMSDREHLQHHEFEVDALQQAIVELKAENVRLAPFELEIDEACRSLKEVQKLYHEVDDQHTLACRRVNAITEEHTASKDIVDKLQCENEKLHEELLTQARECHEHLLHSSRRELCSPEPQNCSEDREFIAAADSAGEDARRQKLAEQEREISQLREEAVGAIQAELRVAQEEVQQKATQARQQTTELAEVSCWSRLLLDERDHELEELREAVREAKQQEKQRFAWSPIQAEVHGEPSSCLNSFADAPPLDRCFESGLLHDLGTTRDRPPADCGQLAQTVHCGNPQKLVWEVLKALDAMQASLPEELHMPTSVAPFSDHASVTALHIHIYMRQVECNNSSGTFMYMFV